MQNKRTRAQNSALELEQGKFKFLSVSGERRNLVELKRERKKMPRSSTLLFSKPRESENLPWEGEFPLYAPEMKVNQSTVCGLTSVRAGFLKTC